MFEFWRTFHVRGLQAFRYAEFAAKGCGLVTSKPIEGFQQRARDRLLRLAATAHTATAGVEDPHLCVLEPKSRLGIPRVSP